MNLILLLIVGGLLTIGRAEDDEDSTKKIEDLKEVLTSVVNSTNRLHLDDKLRNALLKALAELEGGEEVDDDKEVERAQASALTILEESTSSETTSQEPAQFFVVRTTTTEEPHEEQIITSATSSFVDLKTKETILNKGTKSNQNSIGSEEKPTKSTERIETSTEESEAKVEQVQFFSAPLVAAFTVHQDEVGNAKKVEPIFKNAPTMLFDDAELKKKQQFLEDELEKLKQLRNGQKNVLNPVFSEPDRSVVAKVASIDPNRMTKFTANEAMTVDNVVTIGNPPPPTTTTTTPRIISAESKSMNHVSLVPSISYDPLVEAGRLPQNAHILPQREPTGFHSFVKLPNYRPNSQQLAQLNQNRFLRQDQNSFTIVQAQQPFPPQHQFTYYPDNYLRPQQDQRFVRNDINFVPQQSRFVETYNPIQFVPTQNRFLRQSEPQQQRFVLQNYKYSNPFGFNNNLPLV